MHEFGRHLAPAMAADMPSDSCSLHPLPQTQDQHRTFAHAWNSATAVCWGPGFVANVPTPSLQNLMPCQRRERRLGFQQGSAWFLLHHALLPLAFPLQVMTL